MPNSRLANNHNMLLGDGEAFARHLSLYSLFNILLCNIQQQATAAGILNCITPDERICRGRHER
jgi:hypothetical protein